MNGDELERINEFCLQHPRQPSVRQIFPPSGDPSSHEIDAILELENGSGEGRVALEVTRCYQGGRIVGGAAEAKLEQHLFDKFRERVQGIIFECAAARPYHVRVQVTFSEDLDELMATNSEAKQRLRSMLAHVWYQLAEPMRAKLSNPSDHSGLTQELKLSPLPGGALVRHAQIQLVPNSGEAFVRKLDHST